MPTMSHDTSLPELNGTGVEVVDLQCEPADLRPPIESAGDEENDRVRRAEQERLLLQQIETMNAQYQGIPLATVTWRRIGDDFVLVDWNVAAENLSEGAIRRFAGWKAAELLAQQLEVVGDLHHCFDERVGVKRELHCGMLYGEGKPLAAHYVYVPPDMVMMYAEDLSERKRADEQRRQHELALAHVARVSAMGEMVAGLAHELNQPLAAVSNYVAACKMFVQGERPGESSELLGWLDEISSQAMRAGEVIRGLRRFVRKSEPQRVSVALRRLIDDIMPLLTPDARLQEVELRIESRATSLVVHCDPVQIEQVVVNLVRNALDAMRGAINRPREVIIRTDDVGTRTAQVSVVDNGIGLSAEAARRLFEPFFTTKPDGLGIGLTISRSIIEAHGGRMWVAAGNPSGTEFHFTLPLAEVPKSADGN